MLYPENRNRGFATTAIIVTVFLSGIAGGIWFFFLAGDESEVDTVLKTDRAEIFGGSENISQSEEELILGGIGISDNDSVGESTVQTSDLDATQLDSFYSILGVSPTATRAEIDAAWEAYQVRYAGNSTALQIGRTAFNGISTDTSVRGGGPITGSPGDFRGAQPNPFISDSDRNVRFPGFQSPRVTIPTVTIPPTTIDDVAFPDTSDVTITPSTPPSGPNTPTTGRSPSSPPGDSGRPDVIEFEDGTRLDIGSILANLAIGAVAGAAACLFAGKLASLIPGIEVKTADTGNQAKECTLDTLATSVVKNLIANIAADYINWAVSGFPGRPPLFIKDPTAFFSTVLDQEIGRIFDQSGFGFLCDSLGSIDISAALQIQYQRIRVKPPRCSFSDIKDNLSGFVDTSIPKPKISLDAEGGDTIVFGEDAPQFASGKMVESALEQILTRVGGVSSRVTLPGRLAEIDVAVRAAHERVGGELSYRDIVGSTSNPQTLASHETLSDCIRDYEAQGVDHSFALIQCTRIYESADNINNRTQKQIDNQEDACGTGDEFIDDIVCNIVKATMAGLVKRTIEEGLGSTVRRGGTSRIRIAADEVLVGGRGGGWLAARMFGFIGNDPENPSDLPAQNTEYMRILSTEILVKDRNDLFAYMRGNLRSAIPPGYTCLVSRPVGNRGNATICTLGYKNYSGGLNDVNKNSMAPYANGGLVRLADTATSRRAVTYQDCDSFDSCRPKTRTITGFVYREDADALAAALRDNLRESDEVIISTLREIYEATVLAYTELVGTEEEYRTGGDSADSAIKFRSAVIASGNNAEKVRNGASARSVIMDAVLDDFETRRLPVFIRAGSSHLTVLHGCDDTRNRSDDDDTFYRDVTIVDDTYIRTNCTINDLFNTIDTMLLLSVRTGTADVVHFVYAMAHESGFVLLPERSAQAVLSSYPVNQHLAEKYQAFGRIVVGDNTGDARLLTQNWGALTPAQARQEYIDSFESKVERAIAQKFYEFTPNTQEQ